MSSKQSKKKDTGKKEKEFVFKMPEFDEKEYMEGEVRDARITFLIFTYAIMMGAFSFFLLRVLGTFSIPFFIGIGAIYGFRPLLKATGFDTAKIERNKWIGHGFVYFFAWIAFWIIFLNLF